MKRAYLCALLLAVSASLSAQSSKPANGKQSSAHRPSSSAVRETKQVERGGYSIFRGTLVDMSWPEIKKAAESDSLVILPVGVIEEHGPHMSLGADTYLVYQGCRMLQQRLEAQKIRSVIAPPIYWGVMQTTETGAYPGSFTVQPSTMKALLGDVLSDIKTWGFRHVYPVTLHGDRVHRQTFREAMADARQNLGLDIYDEKAQGEARPKLRPYKVEKPFMPDFHAGAQETNEMLTYFPEEVNVAVAKTLQPEGTFHPLGYVGDPANYQNANAILETLVGPVAESIAKWLSPADSKPTPQ